MVERHARIRDVELGLLAASAAIFAVFFAVFVLWLVLSEQDSKLYEADNVVCVSQPLSVQCFERKPR